MSRLIDRVLNDGMTTTLWRTGEAPTRHLLDDLRSALVIVTDDAAQLYWSSRDRWLPADYPNVAPPFELMWMETKRPMTPWGPTAWRSIGALALAREGTPGGVGFTSTVDVPEAHWTMSAWLLVERDSRDVELLPGVFTVAVAADGSIVPTPEGSSVIITPWTDDPAVIEYLLDHEGYLGQFLFATSLMHCKNVELVETKPAAKLSKAHNRRHGRPLVRYHVLEITPMRKVLSEAGADEPGGTKKALHVCRGHFKDYRARGLFGRHHGMYWWEAYIRGDKKAGLVLKDYDVGPE